MNTVPDIVEVARTIEGAELARLVEQATAQKGVYTFGELLQLHNVQQLQNGHCASSYRLLELFAFGVWKDYAANKAQYPELNEEQQRKLRQLSIITSLTGQRSVSLPALAAAVDLAPGSELEALLINHCIYEDLVEGIIDQDSDCFVVQRLAPRDVAPSELPKLAQELAAWMDAVDAAALALEENAALAMQADADKSRIEGEYAKKVVQELESVRLALDIEAAEDEPSTQVAELDTFANPGSNDETPPGLPRHSKRRR